MHDPSCHENEKDVVFPAAFFACEELYKEKNNFFYTKCAFKRLYKNFERQNKESCHAENASGPDMHGAEPESVSGADRRLSPAVEYCLRMEWCE